MGTTKISTANFRGGMKKFGKKSIKWMMVVCKFILVLLAIIFWVVANLLTVVISPVWVPLAFVLAPRWLAKAINAPEKDLPEFFLGICCFANNIWQAPINWLGSRNWMVAYIRNPFISVVHGEPLAKRPKKVQLSYWNWCSHKVTCFRYGVSEDVRAEILERLLWDVNNPLIKELIKEYGGVKYKFLQTLIGAMKLRMDYAALSKILRLYKIEEWEIKRLLPEDRDYLFRCVSKELRKPVIVQDELTATKIHDMWNVADGIELIRYYASKKTLSAPCMLMIIEMVSATGKGGEMLAEIIYREGLPPKLLQKVYDTKRDKLISLVETSIQQYADKSMIVGVDKDPEVNAKRWRRYVRFVSQIDALAQREMKCAQYRVFANAGHHLHPDALEYLLSQIDDKEFIECIITNEFDRITQKLEKCLQCVAWKYAVYCDERAKRTPRL